MVGIVVLIVYITLTGLIFAFYESEPGSFGQKFARALIWPLTLIKYVIIEIKYVVIEVKNLFKESK